LAFPGIEPVQPNDCLDRNLLESAAAQPFQGGYGVEYFYPTLHDKAAVVFFSIAGGHIFGNGNKRTAVLALDQFLLANLTYLLLQNDDMYELALRTATYRTRNENQQEVKARIAKIIKDSSVEFRVIKKKNQAMWTRLQRIRRTILKANAVLQSLNL
jgi:death on curing protein